MTKSKSKVIEEFLGNFHSDSTIRGYRCHLNQFFDVITKEPDNYLKDVRKMENGEKIDALDSYEEDLKKYWNWLIEKEYAPKTVYNGVNAIRQFLKQYRIQLDEIVWQNINRRGTGNKPITVDKPLTKKILKELLTHANAKSRSAFLIMASSGLRKKELMQLQENDIEWETDPIKIRVRHTGKKNQSIKSKYGRYTFITPEAALALREWMKVRKERGITSKRIFPWNITNINKAWWRLLKKARYTEKDEQTGFYVYHLYTLRKFFRTEFGKYDRDLCDFLMGHKHYLTENYWRKTEEDVQKEYLEGMNHIMIFETSVDSERLNNLDEQLKVKDTQISSMEQQIHDLRNQIGGFQNLADDPKFKTEIKGMMDELLKEWDERQKKAQGGK